MKAIVVEDSRLAREGLLNMLKGFAQIEVVGSAENSAAALVLIQKQQPDIIFLDIHMPDESGFDLLEKLDYMPRIIFTTAHSEYSIRSFNYHTIDYLMKPISHKRLAFAINKLTLGDENQSIDAKLVFEMADKIFVNDSEHCHLIKLESIHYFESCRNHARIFFDKKNTYVNKSLNSIEERLPQKHFFRVNRQYIVNLHSIVAIKEAVGYGYEIVMSDGKVLEISRRNAAAIKALLSF
jgi:two-component system, LytTR family, response regulator